MVRMTPAGERLEVARFANDPAVLADQVAKAGPAPEVVLEATYGWYWAADALLAAGALVHLAHPLGGEGVRLPAGGGKRGGGPPTRPRPPAPPPAGPPPP